MLLRLPALFVATGLLLFSIAPPAAAQMPTTLWDRTFGGTQREVLGTLCATSDGGCLLGGWSASGVSGDKTQASQGGDDYWVVKLDATGTKQWDRTFGGNGQDHLTALQQTADGGYLLAGNSTSDLGGDKTQASQGGSDYWIIKLDATGAKQWDKTLGGNWYEYLSVMQQTADGGYVLGGASYSPSSGDKTQPTQGFDDYWLVKLDATGTKQWDKTFGGNYRDELAGLQQTQDGGYIVCGSSDSDLSGDKTQASQGIIDMWLVKLDGNGIKQWDKTYGGSAVDGASAVQQTPDGGYIVAGNSRSGVSGDKSQPSQGSQDYWVLKLDASGTKQWDKTYGGSNNEGTGGAGSVQQTSDGGYLIGGTSLSGVSGDKTHVGQGWQDYWLVKVDATGRKQWDKPYGGSQDETFAGLQPLVGDGYVLGGHSMSGISGDKTQANQGLLPTTDYWIVRLSALPLGTKPASTRPALTAYPNPMSTQLTLRGPLGTPYQLLNQLGQVVRSGQLSAQPLDMQALPAGLYLLRDVTTGRTSKLIKE